MWKKFIKCAYKNKRCGRPVVQAAASFLFSTGSLSGIFFDSDAFLQACEKQDQVQYKNGDHIAKNDLFVSGYP